MRYVLNCIPILTGLAAQFQPEHQCLTSDKYRVINVTYTRSRKNYKKIESAYNGALLWSRPQECRNAQIEDVLAGRTADSAEPCTACLVVSL